MRSWNSEQDRLLCIKSLLQRWIITFHALKFINILLVIFSLIQIVEIRFIVEQKRRRTLRLPVELGQKLFLLRRNRRAVTVLRDLFRPRHPQARLRRQRRLRGRRPRRQFRRLRRIRGLKRLRSPNAKFWFRGFVGHSFLRGHASRGHFVQSPLYETWGRPNVLAL